MAAIQTEPLVNEPVSRQRPAVHPPGNAGDVPRPDGIRDTIESIVVAFILAFVFRAFVVEAFVIPTGSMAPGLYGKHAQHRCGLCDYSFAYGLSETRRNPFRDGEMVAGTLESGHGFTVRCPNCGWTGAGNHNLNATSERRVAGDSGDRILVLKWTYDIGGEMLGPKRWDVVVFKDPQDGDTNFIKRLIGLPGEILEIIDGDIYTAPASALPDDILKALLVPPRHRDDRRLSEAQRAKLAKALTIQRKAAIAQESLWMTHYDHDFTPDLERAQGQPGFNPPLWRAQNPEGDTDWDASTPLVKFSPKNDRLQWLELAGKPILDSYGYNDVNTAPQNAPFVGDVKLSFVLFPGAFTTAAKSPDDAFLILSLRKGDDEFQVKLHPAGGEGAVRLERVAERGVRRELGRGRIEPLWIGRPVEVEFENLDYRVALRVDGREVVATKDSDYAPDILRLLNSGDGTRDRAAVMIGGKNMAFDIRHLAVHRDVFYRSDETQLEPWNVNLRRQNPYAGYRGWGTRNHPIYLRSDPPEFFCCGDNSPQSKDSRLWSEACPILQERGNYQLGTVPGDQMIGRAFYVYWPSGYRFSQDTPAVIPNVGRMRMIR